MNLYPGVVESRSDPLRIGRCQVRVVGVHTDDRSVLPTSDLPWAIPVQPITSAAVSGIGSAPLGPVPGTRVLIMFMDKDQQVPVMIGAIGGTSSSLTDGSAGNINPDGSADGTATGNAPTSPPVITDPSNIVGPLGQFISKNESGAAGYNAFNRGTVGGKIVPAGGTMSLVTTPVQKIMQLQALSPGDPSRLFAVGKYQCIPSTLKSACQSLNIDVSRNFDQQTQDIICQNYLICKKRPPLVAYYNNPDPNNQQLLTNAGHALAAEFASIEDPEHPGYPYGGATGSYYRSGNRANTKWAQLQPILIQEWHFRNGAKSPAAASTVKVNSGSDYQGVAKARTPDVSTTTAPVQSTEIQTQPAPPPAQPQPQPSEIGNTPIGQLAGSTPGGFGISVGGLNLTLPDPLSELNSLIDSALSSVQAQITADLGDLGASGVLNLQTMNILQPLGGNLMEVAGTLGINVVTGTASELANSLGLSITATSGDIAVALAARAGSPAGRAQLLLNAMIPEPTGFVKVPVGETVNGVMSTGVRNPGIGFQDPSGTYPLFSGEPDTPRLTTGNNLGRTIVLKKAAAQVTDVPIANGGSWSQPPVPYNSSYPYNHATQTESGHVFEVDDTPGSERIQTYHKSGTFSEIDATGSQVNHIVGEGYTIIDRNGMVYVKGAYSVTTEGALNLRANNVFNLEVNGAAQVNIFDSAQVNVSKDCTLAVGANLNAKASTINLESTGAFNIVAGSGLNVQSGADVNVKIGGSLYTDSVGNMSMRAGGTLQVGTGSDFTVNSAGIVGLQSAGGMYGKSAAQVSIAGTHTSLSASGDVSIDSGGIVDINNGSSAQPSSSPLPAAAKPANVETVELPVETRGTSGPQALPPIAHTGWGSEVGMDQPNSGNTSEYMNYRVNNALTSATDVSAQRYQQAITKPIGVSNPTPPAMLGSDVVLNLSLDQLVPGLQLSNYFTLGDLTAGGDRIPSSGYVVNGVAYTPQQIVLNLKNLAMNVLDPLRSALGEFRIVSAFRRPAQGSQPGDIGMRTESGDHNTGSAVDVVFPGSLQTNYQAVCTIPSKLQSWNQVIMEYSGSRFWIHLSLLQSNNQGQCFTMISNQVYESTYPNGGFALLNS